MFQAYLVFLTCFLLHKVFSSFLITLCLLIFHSLHSCCFNPVYSLNHLELQHAGITTMLMAKPKKLQAHKHTHTCRSLSFGLCLIFSLLCSRSLIRNSEIPQASFWRLAVLLGWHMVPTYMALQRTMLHSNLVSGMQQGLETACLFSTGDWISPIRNVWYQH